MGIMSELTVSLNGVCKLTDSLELSESSGVAQVNSKVLKGTEHTSSRFLTDIFSQPLSAGDVPKGWKRSNLTPIHERSYRLCPLNYRPVTLISTV